MPTDTGITQDELDHIAGLARIKLTEAERQLYLSQLSSILQYVDLLRQVDTSAVSPSFQVTSQTNVARDDQIRPSLTLGQAQANAPKVHDGYFQVHHTIKK
ncbi:MAG: Asp-tRNA(Asn)/Glu-tRNA(Gln) amidotransferase subunit GatC [Candidatus Shapirobacteria bacterium]|jgi:aspartyl-tRNA(Asn)/glutamyl-tRNA(Gln) amidotransferase subunit C